LPTKQNDFSWLRLEADTFGVANTTLKKAESRVDRAV